MDERIYTVYKAEFAKILLDEGFELLRMGQNPANGKWYMFVFRETPELKQRMQKLMAKD